MSEHWGCGRGREVRRGNFTFRKSIESIGTAPSGWDDLGIQQQRWPPPATRPAKKKSNGHEWIEAEREAMSEKQRALWVAKKKSKKA